jgi:hypothetical protein
MSKTNQISRIAAKLLATIATGTAVLLILSVTVGRKAVAGQHPENDTNLEKNALLESVTNSPDSPLIADNSEGPPLFILSATVKEVTARNTNDSRVSMQTHLATPPSPTSD